MPDNDRRENGGLNYGTRNRDYPLFHYRGVRGSVQTEVGGARMTRYNTELLTIPEAAEEYGILQNTLKRLIKQDKIEYKRVGAIRLIPRAAMLLWMRDYAPKKLKTALCGK